MLRRGFRQGPPSSDVARELRAAARAKRASSRTSGRSARIPRAPGSRRSARLARRPSGSSLGSLGARHSVACTEPCLGHVLLARLARGVILGHVHLLGSSRAAQFAARRFSLASARAEKTARKARALARHITATRCQGERDAGGEKATRSNVEGPISKPNDIDLVSKSALLHLIGR